MNIPLKSQLVLISLLLIGCGSWTKKFNVFPVESDAELGWQVSQSIDSQYENSLLDSASNVELYSYLYSIRDSILNNNQLKHKNDFAWRIRIIDDSTLNAFCTPGGYIYFYTGILRFLESEDELAGIMGHEMAHAEMRHSTDALTRQYGLQILTSVLVDSQYNELANIASGIAQLKYGRSDESESDEYSVRWLYNTSYNATGAAGFFKKMNSSGGSRIPEFLSTHPDPGRRIQNMETLWKELGGKEGKSYRDRYFNKTRKIR